MIKYIYKIVLLVACIVSFLLIAVSTGGNVWLRNDVSSKGLWKSCPYSSCSSYNKVRVWHRTCQVLSVLACILTLTSTMLAIIELIIDRMFLYFISSTVFLAGIFMLSCLAIYTHYTRKSDLGFGWSFVVGWIGVLISTVAGIYGFILERNSASEEQQDDHLMFGWKHVSKRPDSYVIGLE